MGCAGLGVPLPWHRSVAEADRSAVVQTGSPQGGCRCRGEAERLAPAPRHDGAHGAVAEAEIGGRQTLDSPGSAASDIGDDRIAQLVA